MRLQKGKLLRYLFTNDTDTPIDEQIKMVLSEMTEQGVDSEEYSKQLAYLERLHELKAKNRREALSWETIAIIAGNLAGILLIVAYEQKHVITSKAFGQVVRPRVQ